MINITEFEQETELKINRDYNSNNKYYEISGKSYNTIKNRINQYNKKHNANIYCSDNIYKDVTEIYI